MRYACSCLLVLCLTSAVLAEDASRWMMQLKVRGTPVEGTPLHWSAGQVLLLSCDGRLMDFAPGDASHFRKTGFAFKSFSVTQMRDQLERELGKEFEVTSTGSYLVAHPRGQRGQWAERFEELYRSFVTYFRVRGLPVPQPEFPLVAVVWKNQQDFLKQAARDQSGFGSNVLGYYSLASNRTMLYDAGAGQASPQQRQQNLDTVMHEAAHQVAFNTGIHSRFAPPPRWVTEGLGTMFEAPGIWNSRAFSKQTDRFNQGRLQDFKFYVKSGRKGGTTADLISSDRFFETNATAAYAEAWAFSFFLSETQPREYVRYLAVTAGRPPFQAYPSAQRLADFTSVFGPNLPLLEARFLRYMETIR